MNFVVSLPVLYYILSINFLIILTTKEKLTPFTYTKFYKIVDRHVAMGYFAKKLGIDNYMTDYVVLKRTQPYIEWQNEYAVEKESVRNIDSCSLRKTDPNLRAEDAVSEVGLQNCFQQCKMENKVYFKFLNSKLQKLIKNKCDNYEFRLTDTPVPKTSWKKYYKCAKKGYKRYICECKHQQYAIKTSDAFKKTFDKLIRELYGLSPSRDNSKKLEEKYKIPMKLIYFIISYHLLPTEIFGFLLWWYTAENPEAFTTTTTTFQPLEEESEGIFSEESYGTLKM